MRLALLAVLMSGSSAFAQNLDRDFIIQQYQGAKALPGLSPVLWTVS
jgi:hypothetical protein